MTGFSFSKSCRLLTAADFAAVFDRTRTPYKVSTSHLLLLAIPNQCTHARLGLVIAKKKIRRACARNRIKRLAREAFRLQQHQLPAVDIVVQVRLDTDQLSNDALQSSFSTAWQKLSRKVAG